MKKLFELLGLIENHRMVLEISKDRFIELLSAHVGNDTSSSMDLFSSDYIHYKGVVGRSGFYLRRKRGFLNNTRHFCKVTGSFTEENRSLIIDLEFKNFSPPVYAYLGLTALFGMAAAVMLLGTILRFDFSLIGNAFSNLISVFVLSAIIGAIVRISSSKTILKMRYELENNFNKYLTSKI